MRSLGRESTGKERIDPARQNRVEADYFVTRVVIEIVLRK
jgi:hypothetical protein